MSKMKKLHHCKGPTTRHLGKLGNYNLYIVLLHRNVVSKHKNDKKNKHKPLRLNICLPYSI